MGNYNPHQATIIGQEWVPIRNELTKLNHLIDEVEYGHSFTLNTSRTLQDGRFYVHQMESNVSTVTYKMAVYPRGMESNSGPIKSVLIPVSTVAVTGSCTAVGSPPSGAEALLTPAVDYYYNFSINSTLGGQYSVMWLQFATSSTTYSNLLTGKRILGVNILLGASIDWTIAANGPLVGMTNSATVFGGTKFRNEFNCPTGAFATPTSRFKFGEFPPYNSAAIAVGEVLPWTYADLQLLNGGGSVFAEIATGSSLNGAPQNHSMQVWYAALEVIYCEEQRVALGGWGYGPAGRGGFFINYGANPMPMRTWQGKAASPVLPAGDYTLTLSSFDLGDIFAPAQISPLELNACRQLYALPQQAGVQVNLPYPFEDNTGEVFTKQETDVLPQLTLHTSTGPLNEVHVYGRQAKVQVLGGFNAEQDIFNSYGGNQSYSYARFYARHFGDTTASLNMFGVGGAVGSGSILPADFDLLPEIVDGWKEVTLTLTTPATLGNNVSSTYRFTADGELPGSRWEILAAAAPAISGLPGNLYGQVVSTQQLGGATYYAPTGAAYSLKWYPGGVTGPYVASSTTDTGTDAALMFALKPPTVTGFSGSVNTQSVVGVGLNCGLPPCGIATGVFYNHLTWPLPPSTGVLFDELNRTVAAGGWGTADSGQTWVPQGSASNFSVNTTNGGIIQPDAFSVDRIISADMGGINQDVTILASLSSIPSSGSVTFGAAARITDGSNNITARAAFTPTTITLAISQRIAGVITGIATLNIPELNTSGSNRDTYVRLQVEGSFVRAKMWSLTQEEPDWMIMGQVVAATTGTGAGAWSRNDGNSLAQNVRFESVTVNPPDYSFGYMELQREDSIDDWATIMQATSPAVTSFNDYEARVGLQSSYRVRRVDNYGFVGDWSSTVNLTTTSPGATGGACLSRGHMLLFSSNMSQSGAYTLAYSSAWEDGQVSEEFSFPESSFVQLQPMYNRDFFTAFRPEERGGDRFQRTVLVQAAAISPETLADFTSLRDMAWAGNPYTCVRDEDGNRWFASVGVPGGKVVHDRTIYLATVDIAEVTDTPAPVDP